MGKKKYVYQNQLKTVSSIEERIQALIEKHRSLKDDNLGVMFRTVIDPNQTTTYEEGFHGRGKLNKGVRECDFKFSESNPDWIEASDKHGLSFSSTMDHAIDIMEFLGKLQKKSTKINMAYWILEGNPCIPQDMKFVKDPKSEGHYLLTITKSMTINQLVEKLRWISQRMAIMNDLTLEAYKDA